MNGYRSKYSGYLTSWRANKQQVNVTFSVFSWLMQIIVLLFDLGDLSTSEDVKSFQDKGEDIGAAVDGQSLGGCDHVFTAKVNKHLEGTLGHSH